MIPFKWKDKNGKTWTQYFEAKHIKRVRPLEDNETQRIHPDNVAQYQLYSGEIFESCETVKTLVNRINNYKNEA